MNSSGIKRGLAVSAISALAVAGIPALATSASAAPGDVLTVATTGPALNGGAEGAVVVLNTRGIDPADLAVIGANLTDSEDNANQSVAIVGTPTLVASGAPGDTTPNDQLDQITVRVSVTTPAAGATANFAIFEDEDGDAAVDATESRSQVSIQTAGPVAQIDVTPASQTAPVGQESADYTVVVRDAAGRATQLTGAQELDVTAAGGVTTFGDAADGGTITQDEITTGTATFTATGTGTSGLRTITVAADGAGISGTDTATLDVVTAATLDAGDIDVVTGADSWTGFGDVDDDATDPDNPVAVRVDQSSIRIDIASDDVADRGATVVFNIDGTDVGPGNGLTFGGRPTATVATTLDAQGRGSVTITPDAGTIQDGDTFTVGGSGLGTLNFQFQRAELSAVQAPANVYISGIDGSVNVSVTTTDQFGLPIAGAQVDAARTLGANSPEAFQPRKTTDANGQATFTFTDVNAVPGQTSEVTFRAFADQFDATPDAFDTATIRYTADGLGADFTLSLDGVNTAGTAYNPASVSIEPLTDTVANDGNVAQGDEVANLGIVGGENGAPVTVSVDNGARILVNGDTRLSDGVASATGVVGTDTFEIVGTKAGLTTVTVTSAGRTKTAQLTVEAQDDQSTARNVSISGPATAPADTEQITYTAVVTDAFGNAVAGVPVQALNIQVSGPGSFQDSDAQTNAQGQLNINVDVDDNAEGSITVRVEGIQGFGYQFGAAANQATPGSTAGAAEGLPVSSNVASATTTIDGKPTDPDDKVTINAGITSESKGKYDVITVNARRAGADANVKLFRVKNGVAKRVKQKALGEDGVAKFKRADLNGSKATRYYAVVGESATSLKDKTKTISVK
ncbi:hypothetical protein [Nocardioides sp. Arc9.136]|uniref:beta strand repeat-containing protein n=1 Tax=Nocardioides sp. Arc9.136 TaxID=2996826 RepID=UPI002665F3A1|nr:hypothetical protein [Nocardioides sp. Arc9.136]WKN49545.1 hypothetical protein OSR43_05285 [Nocardioides sp. Arc9.136]